MAVKGVTPKVEQTVLCCHDGCGVSAVCKVRTKTGWANVCKRHYDEYYHKQAVEYCQALGLNTTAERIAWLKQHAKGLTRRYTANIPPREPGEDREEDAA